MIALALVIIIALLLVLTFYAVLTEHDGEVRCDICGEWGRPNLNYKGCDGRAFVHTSKGGTRFLHSRHVTRHIAAEAAEREIKR